MAHGADVRAKDSKGVTPYKFASRKEMRQLTPGASGIFSIEKVGLTSHKQIFIYKKGRTRSGGAHIFRFSTFCFDT